MEARAATIDDGAIRAQALSALERMGPLAHGDLVAEARRGTNKVSAGRVVRMLEREGAIWRESVRSPWRLKRARAGYCEANGYAPAVSSNSSPKTKWKSLIYANHGGSHA
jgi:hypothetical protein